MSTQAVLAAVTDQPGMLFRLTKVFAERQVNITHVDLHTVGGLSEIYFELSIDETTMGPLLDELRRVPGVVRMQETSPLSRVYGKRVIVMGGGAQVGQVALGAITEADRHNIRGEHISVDTIPLVGEEALAAAVRAVMLLPRVKMLVLAGSIMGGAITTAVEEVRKNGLPVISLNMAGSVPEAADLVVTDPVQAGVMAVMAVADTAKFDIMRQLKKKY